MSSFFLNRTFFVMVLPLSLFLGCGLVLKEEDLKSRNGSRQLNSPEGNSEVINQRSSDSSQEGGNGSKGGDNSIDGTRDKNETSNITPIVTPIVTPYVCQKVTKVSLQIPRDCCLFGQLALMVTSCGQFDLSQCNIVTCE